MVKIAATFSFSLSFRMRLDTLRIRFDVKRPLITTLVVKLISLVVITYRPIICLYFQFATSRSGNL